MLSKEGLRQLKENELRQHVLLPLLRAMEYCDVYEYHGGAGEQGKDIVCWRADMLGNRANLALVVKAGPITGRAATTKGSAGEVHMQVRQCFGKGFLDPVTGEERPVHECWIVSSQRISKEAEESITSSLKDGGLARNVRFVNGDKLWELVEQFLGPRTVLGKLMEAQSQLEELDEHYTPDIRLSPSGGHLALQEKYPGAAAKKPLPGTLTLSFPNTPEGIAAREAFERFRATGATVEIPGAFVEFTDLPELINKLMGEDVPVQSIALGSNPAGQTIPVRVELESASGQTVVLDYIELRAVQGGEDEVTITNADQLTPARVVIRLDVVHQRLNLQFDYSPPSYNVYHVLFALRLQQCLSEMYSARVIDLNTGITIIDAPLRGAPSATTPAPGLLEEIADLAEI